MWPVWPGSSASPSRVRRFVTMVWGPAGRDPATLPSVFASTHGDLTITDTICATLAADPRAMSPGTAMLRGLQALHFGNYGHGAVHWLYFVLGLGAKGVINRKDFNCWGQLPKVNSPEFNTWTKEARKFGKAIWDITGKGNDVDFVFEHPGEATFPVSTFVVKRGGMVVFCAGTSGFNITFDARYVWMRQKRIQGSHFAHLKQAAAANKFVLDRRIDPLAINRRTLRRIPACRRHLEHRAITQLHHRLYTPLAITFFTHEGCFIVLRERTSDDLARTGTPTIYKYDRFLVAKQRLACSFDRFVNLATAPLSHQRLIVQPQPCQRLRSCHCTAAITPQIENYLIHALRDKLLCRRPREPPGIVIEHMYGQDACFPDNFLLNRRRRHLPTRHRDGFLLIAAH